MALERGPREQRDARRLALVVLGMHRSGTSALARVVNLLGASLPANVVGPTISNEAGHWEPQHLVSLHDQMLDEAASRWDDWRTFDPGTVGSERLEFYKGQIRRLITEEYRGAPLFVLKDPRICRFVPLYQDVLARLGIGVRFLLIHRNPLAVIDSLARRDDMTDGFAGLLWLRHVLDAEWATRRERRVFLSYEELLADWRGAMNGIAGSLGLVWTRPIAEAGAEIDAHLRRDLQHHHRTLADLHANGHVVGWLKDAYAALLRLGPCGAESEASLTALARIRRQFDAAGTFGQATFPELAARERRMSLDLRRLSVLVQQREQDLTALRQRVVAVEAELQARDAALVGHRDELRQRVAAHEAELQARDAALGRQRDELGHVSAELDGKAAEIAGLSRAHAAQIAWGKELHSRLGGLEAELAVVYGSRSWRLTAPLRFLRRGGDLAHHRLRSLSSRMARVAYQKAPLPLSAKLRMKDVLFRHVSPSFRHTRVYRAWRHAGRAGRGGNGDLAHRAASRREGWQPPVVEHVPLVHAAPPAAKPVRIVAFYLPQFHSIPENDQWWGEGFTEWTNVRRAQPQFVGHHQPHAPGELGYYLLDDTAVQRRQIELAKLYGIEGFCFYFYRFGGTRLLEKPLENWLHDTTLDLPFCLCWANENWTRRWDGLESEILIAQQYSPDDDLGLIQEVAPYLSDARYIRVDGRPLFLVYRPDLLPSARATAERWRTWCRQNGIGEIFLAYTQSFDQTDPRPFGFDAAVEFPPNNSNPPNVTAAVVPHRPGFAGTVYDWSVFPARSERYGPRDYPLFRTVCPGWDNTPRRGNRGTVFVNNTPAQYRRWLENAIRETLDHVQEPSARLIFVNAWNEWAEGAHLEPDAATGYAYLQASRDALERAAGERRPGLVVVSHDAHPHGAQMIALNVTRGYRALGLRPEVIVLGDGDLLQQFEEVAPVHRLDLARQDEREVVARLEAIRKRGAEIALVNTTVSGALVPLLKHAGFRTLSLVHELPGILTARGLERQAVAIAEHADTLVFPAQSVRAAFERLVGKPLDRAVIRPQGCYMRMPFRDSERAAVRGAVRDRLGLRPDARILLSAGYGDHRKGLDLFVEAGIAIMATDPRAAAVWVGSCDPALFERLMARIHAAGLERRFVFTGFLESPQELFFAADVYALPSREDPFPSVVIEALDAGLPVVAFAGAGGFEELLTRGCGILVTAFEPHAMAVAIGALFDDPERAAALARHGREIVRWELTSRRYLHDLLHLAGSSLPRVSVVVPNYNYARYLADRLASIERQTVPAYEVIVLDDASTDGSVAIIEESLARLNVASMLVVNEQNSGSAFRQWLRGVELARGDFVWIAEADDLADPGFLQEVLPAFQRSEVVLSYCQSRQMDADGRILCEHYLDYVEDVDRERWRRPYVADGRDEIARALFLKNTIPNVSGVVFRRDALRRMLLANADEITSFRCTGDWVAYIRLLESGAVAFSPRAFNSHRRHASSLIAGNSNLQQLQEIVRVQQETIGRHDLGPRAVERAASYAQRLYEQFALDSDVHPRFHDHPGLGELVGRR